MKLYKIFFTGLFLVSTSFVSAQEYKTQIKAELNEYLIAIMEGDFEKSMDYITPELFTIIPKSQMVSLMEQTFNNSQVEFELKNPKILDIRDAEKVDEKYYSLLTYSNQMNMKFHGAEGESEEDASTRTDLTLRVFEQKFGPENVVYNEETDFFEVQVEKQAYAISENGETDWKFLVLDKEQRPLLEKILPIQLLDKL